ncbi:MAG TPA: TadE/TadG family type IV pilus assembly protein [Candidatus Limnocylindria bacterium]
MRVATGERGQALVEFALVLPILLILALAIAELAQVGVARLALEHGAAEGARIGALTNSDELIRATVAATVTPLDPAQVEIAIDPPASARPAQPRGSLIRVQLRYALPAPLGFTGLPAFAIRGAAARRMEWTP